MSFAPLSAEQIADARIPARAVLVFTCFIFIVGACAAHYFPLGHWLPGMHPARQYDWLELILTLGIFGMLFRHLNMSVHQMVGARPSGIRDVLLSIGLGATLYSFSYVLGFLRASIEVLDGSFADSNSFLGVVAFVPYADTYFPIGEILGMVSSCAIVPISEELVFRGLLLRRLLQKFRPCTALLLSTIAFTLIHIDKPNLAFPFIGGLLLGYLYIRTGSLWLTIVAHSATNLSSFLLNAWWRLEFDRDRQLLGFPLTAFLFVLSGLLAISIASKLLRAIVNSDEPDRGSAKSI